MWQHIYIASVIEDAGWKKLFFRNMHVKSSQLCLNADQSVCFFSVIVFVIQEKGIIIILQGQIFSGTNEATCLHLYW